MSMLPVCSALLVAVLHLSQDLGFTQYHGIETGCDTQYVAHGLGFLICIQMRLQAGRVQLVEAAQPLRDLLDSLRVLVDVQLGTVTGRQDGRLLDAVQRLEFAERTLQ